MKFLNVIALLLMLAGCASQSYGCHGRLKPINQPTTTASLGAHP